MNLLDDIWLQIVSVPWHMPLVISHIILASIACLHALLYKRDSRAALGWLSICLLFPIFGPLFYFFFGINRIRTKAQILVGTKSSFFTIGFERGEQPQPVDSLLSEFSQQSQTFVKISDSVSNFVLTKHNKVTMLVNGEQTYPAMIDAIDRAQSSILLSSYIFESDDIGQKFIAALITANKRQVEIKVIIDGIGDLYSWPRISRTLKNSHISFARFLPPKLFPPSLLINLRNHRKILVIDGLVGFTGGMNISDRHLIEKENKATTVDLHFRIEGPVVLQLESIFADDWKFCTGESIQLSPTIENTSGDDCCRCIPDGPSEDLDKIALILSGAVSAARKQVVIVTPYFLPSREIIASLQSAALRGVEVIIIIPQKSNLRFVDWATRNLLWELLQYSVKIYYQPLPFAHTKLLLIDHIYAQVGSANIDPRSLRLNFELNMEIVSGESVAEISQHIEMIIEKSKQITLSEIESRALLPRIRDAFCWLFMPYL